MGKLKYFVVILLLFVVIYLVVVPYIKKRAMEIKSPKNLESGVILYDLEGYQFDVPLKYYYLIYQKSKIWPTPKKERQSVKSFEIDVVLPDMLPFSEQTAAKFEARGWKDKMWITLWSRNNVINDLGGWFKKRRHKFTVIGPSNEAPGLIYLIDHFGPAIENDKNYKHMFLKSTNNFEEYFYMRCHRNLAEGGVPFPSCTLHTKYNELELRLTFARKYVSNWKEIMTDSMKLLDRFRVNIN